MNKSSFGIALISWAAMSLNALAANTITAITVTTNSATQATVKYTTSTAVASDVKYGATTSYGKSVTASSKVKAHSVVITGLKASTTYHYQIVAGAVVSPDATFSTPAKAGASPSPSPSPSASPSSKPSSTPSPSPTVSASPKPSSTPNPSPTGAALSAYLQGVLKDSPSSLYPLGDASAALQDVGSNHLNGSYGSAVNESASGILAGDSQDKSSSFPGGSISSANMAVVAANSGLQPTGAISLEAWINPSASNTSGSAVDFVTYGSLSTEVSYTLQVSPSNTIEFFITMSGNFGDLTGNQVLSIGQSYHVVGVYNGSTMSIYINGVLDSSQAASGAVDYSSIGGYGLSLGAAQGSNRNAFAGSLQAVGIYSSALSASQVAAHYSLGSKAVQPSPSPTVTPSATPSPSPTKTATPYQSSILSQNPLAFLSLSDSGATLSDAVSSGGTGSYGSGVTLGSSSILAQNGGPAATFIGGADVASSIATISAASALQPTAALSLDFWIKPTALNTSGSSIDLVGYGSASTAIPYSVQLSPSNQIEFWLSLTGGSAGDGDLIGNTVLQANQSYNIAATYNGSVMSIYVNGSLDASLSVSGAINYAGVVDGAGTSGLSLGGLPGMSRQVFQGEMADVAVYGSALSSSQVGSDYTEGSGTAVKPAPSPTPTSTPTSAPSTTPAGGTFLGLSNGADYPLTFTPYASNSVYNTPVSSNPKFISNSAAIVAEQFPNPTNAAAFVRSTEAGIGDYSHPRFFATTSDPVINLVCDIYCDGTEPKSMYIPAQARPAGGSDAHLEVIQPDGTEIDMWATYGWPGSGNGAANDMQTRNWQNGDTATAGAIGNLGNFQTGSALGGSGPGMGIPSTAANTALSAGIVTAAELISGQINHALDITGQCAIGSQYPSTGATQQCTSGMGPPLGGREWYDVPCSQTQAQPTRTASSNPTGALWPWEKGILCALNVYGGYFGDNGSGGAYFTGGVSGELESEEPWRDYYGTGPNNSVYTSPFAPLASQGWTSFQITAIGSAPGNRWYYPGSDNNQDWIPVDANGNPINWVNHIHWLAACSAQGTC